LRTHLQAPPSAPEGMDLLTLCQKLLTSAVRPVLKEVNITGALSHVMSGMFSTGKGRASVDIIPTPEEVAQETLKAMKDTELRMKRGVDNVAGCCLLTKDSCLRNILHAGADKFIHEADNRILLRSSLAEGLLDKRVTRWTCRGWSRPVLEWVVLKKGYGGLVLYYTKKTKRGFEGATKKIRVRKVRFDRDSLQLLLEDKGGKRRKCVMFREAPLGEVATEDQRLPLSQWWAAVAPGVAPGQDWVVLPIGAGGASSDESSDDEAPLASPARWAET